jgi:hypothetical protein
MCWQPSRIIHAVDIQFDENCAQSCSLKLNLEMLSSSYIRNLMTDFSVQVMTY